MNQSSSPCDQRCRDCRGLLPAQAPHYAVGLQSPLCIYCAESVELAEAGL